MTRVLNVENLTKELRVPLDWEKQRRALGFDQIAFGTGNRWVI